MEKARRQLESLVGRKRAERRDDPDGLARYFASESGRDGRDPHRDPSRSSHSTHASAQPSLTLGVTGGHEPSQLTLPLKRGKRVKTTAVECLVCECSFDSNAVGAKPMTCPACVALRNGLVTPTEAGEMRLLTRLSLMQGDEAA